MPGSTAALGLYALSTSGGVKTLLNYGMKWLDALRALIVSPFYVLNDQAERRASFIYPMYLRRGTDHDPNPQLITFRLFIECIGKTRRQDTTKSN
jgi:hypothetical protein